MVGLSRMQESWHIVLYSYPSPLFKNGRDGSGYETAWHIQ